MILQQTLSAKEKVASIVAVFFLVGLVTFGYTQTVVVPAQASILHAGSIEANYTHRFDELNDEFKSIRENVDTLKSVPVKAKLRSIKECLVGAELPESSNQKTVTAAQAFADCEKLFVEAAAQIDTLGGSVTKLDEATQTLEKNVTDYAKIVDQALDELKKKNAATLGKVGH